MTMKPHLDYATNYDAGNDAVTAIQPVINGEAASQNVIRRPSENLRGRSETLRAAVDELFYFRDKPTYQLSCASAGQLAWGGTVASGGTGILNNTTELTISPLGGAMANTKGVIGIGTAGTNRVNYTVPGSVYATHGVNRWSIEHRPITGQATIQVQISAGPNYFILVTYDDTNNSHDAFAVAVAANLAITANAGTTGKLAAAGDAIASNAVSSSSGPVTFFDGVVSSTISGTPTVDIEAHTIPAGALGTLTTTTPLVEGATILIAYRDLIEPAGGDPLDAKGVAAGGRAESNPARGNTAVTANLVILSGAATDGLHLSGAIPLVRILRGAARFIDGTGIASGYSVLPGVGLGAAFSAAAFHGPTTAVTNGGILTSDTTLQLALNTIDTRLAQRRTATWTVTDGANSVGGDYTSSTGLIDAAVACNGDGGLVHVRRGVYDIPAPDTYGVENVVLEGEAGTLPEWTFADSGTTLTGPLTIRNMKLSRTLGAIVIVTGGLRLENCELDTGLFDVQGGDGSFLELIDVKMIPTSQSEDPIYGIGAHVASLRVLGGTYEGPDTTVDPMSVTPDTRLGVFDVNDYTSAVEIRGAFIPNDARAGWRPVTRLSSNAVTTPTMAHIQLRDGGTYVSTANTFDVGFPEDLTTSKNLTRFNGTRGDSQPEPSRVVFHPELPLDLSDAPGTRTAPLWSTPELELLEITDPRTAPVAGYVVLPAEVTLTDIGSYWRIDFATDARGTLEYVAAGDVVEILDSGFYRVRAVNRAAPTGSIVIAHLDGRVIAGAPPAGTNTMRYYRVVRGHIGGLSETGIGSQTYDSASPDMDYLPADVDVVEGHRLLGGLIIDGDNSGGLAVGRRRGDDIATAVTDLPNFTPDFIVARDGVTYVRDLIAKAATFASAVVDGVLAVGAVLDVEAAVAAATATLGTWVNSAGEWNYAAPLALTLAMDPTGGSSVEIGGVDWHYENGGTGARPKMVPAVSAVALDVAEYLLPLNLPRGFIITKLNVEFKSSFANSGTLDVQLYSAASSTALDTFTNIGYVDTTYTSVPLTPGAPRAIGSAQHSIAILYTATAGPATCQISAITVEGTIPGPR